MAFSPYVEGILLFIQNTTPSEDASPDYLKTCYNLLGDLASTYKQALKNALLEPGITRVLGEAKNRGIKQRDVTNAAKYARQVRGLMSCFACRDLSKLICHFIVMFRAGGQSGNGLMDCVPFVITPILSIALILSSRLFRIISLNPASSPS
jgi:hypothetical protein